MEIVAAEFILKEGPKFDPAFGLNAVYDKQRAEIRPRMPVHDLQDAIHRYQRSGHKLKLNPEQCTWEDVIDAFETAREEYDRKASGIAGVARKIWRNTGDHASRLTPLLEMIPDDMGLRTLRAGLVFVVTMAKESARKREAILTAFADIPLHFGLVERKLKIHPNDVALKRCSVELHDALMQAIPQLITHLLPKKRFNLFPLIVKIPTEADVDKILATIKSKCEMVNRKVEDILEETIVDLGRTSQVIRDTSFEIRTSTSQLKDSSIELKQGHDEIRTELRELKDSQQELFRTFAYLANNGMLQFLVGPPGIRRQEQNRRLLQGSLQGPAPPLQALITMEELFSMLDVPLRDLLFRDFQGALGSRESADHVTRSQSESLLQDPQFQRWYYSSEQDVILVDGSMRDMGSASLRATPLSSICAILATAVLQMPGAVPLAFLCGLHTSPTDRMSGPGGLIRALVAIATARLHWSGQLNLDFINSHRHIELLRAHDVWTLCRTLERLICQFGWDTTLYCVVDGITWCERPDWSEDLQEVIQTLLGLTRVPRCGPIVKVLMTCPVRSREVIRYFPFNLPEHQIILAHHQQYELEWDFDRLAMLNMRDMRREESEHFMIGEYLDRNNEDYT